MKRWIFALLAAGCLVLAVMPVVWAADDAYTVSYPVTGGNIEFDKSTGTVTNCDQSVTAANIPNQIEGVSVTSIGNLAFYVCNSLTSVTIPSSVTSIDTAAFYGCSALTGITVAADNPVFSSIDGVLFNKAATTLHTYPGGKSGGYAIPNSVTSIGDSAFNECSGLTSITIPNSVTSIGYWAFWGCSGLTSMTIPDSVTSIGYAAFHDCSGLTSVTIPDSVTSIDNVVFRGCSSLAGITVAADNPVFSSIDGVLFDKTVTTLYTYPGGNSGGYSIPNSVTSIGDNAFDGCSGLTSVTIPDSVTSIGHWAFGGCSALTSVTIPGSVTYIGIYAFEYSSLTDVYYDGTEAEYKANLLPSVICCNDILRNATFHFQNSPSPNPTPDPDPTPNPPPSPNLALPNTAAQDNTALYGIVFLVLLALTLTVWILGRRKKGSD